LPQIVVSVSEIADRLPRIGALLLTLPGASNLRSSLHGRGMMI